LIFGGLKEGLDLNRHVILKLWREFVEKTYHPLELVVWAFVIHFPLSGFKPEFTNAAGEGNEADNPVIDLPEIPFQFGDVAIADTSGNGEFNLGHPQVFTEFPDTIIDEHIKKYSE
jgi:hypothetical protein